MALSSAAAPENHRRDWARLLPDGPAGLVAERLLADDVAGYVRFRAVCRPWRRCCPDPRPGSLDRRFHPRRWTMLRERLAAPHRRRFLNTSTGEFIQVDHPELRGHKVLAQTPEGLLVLLQQPQLTSVRLFNPLTGQLARLPPLTTLLPPADRRHLSDLVNFDWRFAAWGSGIAEDGSTVVLCFCSLRMLGIAKPGDEHWTMLRFDDHVSTAALMFAGRFYCFTLDGVMVLEMNDMNHPPRLAVAAWRCMGVATSDTAHLVDNAGELMLVRRARPLLPGDKLELGTIYGYEAYRVDLDSRALVPADGLGGERALFLGWDRSFTVPTEVFPSGSISADTFYLSFEFKERGETEAYHLADRRNITPAAAAADKLLAQPHTLVDCLSLCGAALPVG